MSIAMGRFLLVSCANMLKDVALRGKILNSCSAIIFPHLVPSLLKEVLGTARISDGNHIG